MAEWEILEMKKNLAFCTCCTKRWVSVHLKAGLKIALQKTSVRSFRSSYSDINVHKLHVAPIFLFNHFGKYTCLFEYRCRDKSGTCLVRFMGNEGNMYNLILQCTRIHRNESVKNPK